jgi:hypothetical protein
LDSIIGTGFLGASGWDDSTDAKYTSAKRTFLVHGARMAWIGRDWASCGAWWICALDLGNIRGVITTSSLPIPTLDRSYRIEPIPSLVDYYIPLCFRTYCSLNVLLFSLFLIFSFSRFEQKHFLFLVHINPFNTTSLFLSQSSHHPPPQLPRLPNQLLPLNHYPLSTLRGHPKRLQHPFPERPLHPIQILQHLIYNNNYSMPLISIFPHNPLPKLKKRIHTITTSLQTSRNLPRALRYLQRELPDQGE